MPYNASDRKQVRAAEKAVARAEHEKIDFLKSMLSQPGGRHWFNDLLATCHLFSDPFTGDPIKEAFLKGERNIGLLIFADIVQHCPDQYINMMKEANVRRSEFDAAINPQSDPGQHPGSEDSRWNPEGSSDAFIEPSADDV